MNLGQKLKDLRKVKNLTQEELAERTDLTKGYISQIESSHASPSLDKFLIILEVLGTEPSDFFKQEAEMKVLYPKEQQITYDEYDDGYLLNWLVNQSNEFEMEPLLITLRAYASYKQFAPSDSETFIYCLKGCVKLDLGEHEYYADPGDALYFKANQMHCLSNPSDQASQALIVVTASYL
ncbi:XRE family transcriptional regulator [Staphylococcus sp. SQ8-PEA]|uniref:XRE family transcriptional regulator n=1 Tax=Staphylococcus marylandisciuri TaxID=2981529 RepID=A0ABT2QNU4_9STAP|nr:XRE family transcriptional regulator [Staphylococcus marylandisciuri]MCU5745648.1 XRE family transcriptional regulator [Staphylococcus marylandisciuri]